MSEARRHAESIAQLAQAIAVGWGTYESTEAALSNSTIPSAGGGVSGGDVPDPVGSCAASHGRYWVNRGRLQEAFGLLRLVQSDMAKVRRQHPETAREVDAAVKAARCSGAEDPLCTNNAVRESGQYAGLCWKCIKRQQRRDEQEEQAS